MWSIVLEQLGGGGFECIVGNGLDQQVLCRDQHIQDTAARLPHVSLQYPNAHASLLVEGDVGVPDAGLEVDSGGLEGVFNRKIEEELEFTALVAC